MFWLLATALTVTVALAILWPFWRDRSGGAAPAAAYDLRVYRDQLAEVERDLARNIIDPSEAGRLRTEIGRKVLEADRRLGREGPTLTGGRHVLIAALLLALAVGGGWGLYAWLGTPGQPDMGLKARFAAADARHASRPSQAEAEAMLADTPRPAPPQPDPDFARLMTQLRAAVAEHPDDARGLALLAQNEARLGNPLAAKEAQQKLVAILGDRAKAEDYAFLAGVMTEAAGGLITAEAEAELARALKLDPANPQARYMSGLLQAQNGRPDRAFPIWAGLLRDTPADSPWNGAIRPVIRDIAWLAGQPDYQPPSPDAALPGPDADALEAAAGMTPEDRQAFIRNMVAQLESRLATEGGTPEEWARLISSLGVLGDTGHAQDIYVEAQSRFAATPEALSQIEAAARQAGIAP